VPTAREQGARYNLIIACMISGIKTAGTLSGHVYGTGEPERKCKGKRAKTRMGKSEIPIFLSGADEVVVVRIFPETGKERRASHEEFLFV
jgi:hypothetical protein